MAELEPVVVKLVADASEFAMSLRIAADALNAAADRMTEGEDPLQTVDVGGIQVRTLSQHSGTRAVTYRDIERLCEGLPLTKKNKKKKS